MLAAALGKPLRILLAILVLTLALASGMSHPASAQVTATVSPSLLELNAKAGATGEQPITMSITSGSDVAVTAAIAPYDTPVQVRSATDWLTLDTTEHTVSSGNDAVFTLSVAVPKDAEDGGYYAAVTLTMGQSGAAEAGQAAIQGRFVVPVLINIGDPKNLKPTAELTRIAPVLEQDGRIGIWGEMHNTGTIAVRAPGDAQIADDSGHALAKLQFPDTTPILPGETRVIRATGTLPLPADTTYSADVSIDYGGKKPAGAKASFTVKPVTPEGQVSVCENLDRGPTVTVQLSSSGDLGLAAGVSLAINDASGNQVVATTLANSLLVWPDEEQTVSTDAPNRLESGSYTLVAQVQAGSGDPTVITFPFDIGGNSPQTAPLCPPPATPANQG